VGLGQVVQDQAVQGPVGLCQVVQGQVVQGQVVHGQVAQGPVVQGQVGLGQVVQGQVAQGPVGLGQVVQGQVVQGQVVQGQWVQGQVGLGQVVQGQVFQGQGLGQVVQGHVGLGQVVQGQVAQGPVVQGQVQVDQGQGQGPISLQGIQDPRVDGSQLAGIVGEGGFGLHFRGGERTKLNPEKKNFKGQGGERFELNSGKRKFRELGGEQSEDEVDCGGLDFQEQNTDRSAVGDFEFSGSEEIGVKKKKRASGAARKRQKRRSSEGLEKKNEKVEAEEEEEVHSEQEEESSSSTSLQESFVTRSSIYLRLKKYIQTGELPASPKDRKRIIAMRNKWSVDSDGNLMFLQKSIWRIQVTDFQESLTILRQFHQSAFEGGHGGIMSTYSKISSRYRWPELRSNVEEFIKGCPECQSSRQIKTCAPALRPIKTSRVLQMVCLDLITLPKGKEGDQYVCTFTDHFSKYVAFYALKTKEASGVVECLEDYMMKYGPPESILTDQGREFINCKSDNLLDKWGIARKVTSAYHPQCNGLAERSNRTLKEVLVKYMNEHQDDWKDKLGLLAFSINTRKQASTKHTPFFLMYLRHPNLSNKMEVVCRCLAEGTIVTEQMLDEFATEKQDLRNKTDEKVKENITKAQEKQSSDYNQRKAKGVKSYDFKVGDKVLKRIMRNVSRKGGKCEKKWAGPYKISCINFEKKRIGLEQMTGIPLKSKVAWDQLTPYTINDYYYSEDSQPCEEVEEEVPPLSDPKEDLVVTFLQPNDATLPWLEDRHIDLCQEMIKKDVGNLYDGFQSVCVLQLANEGDSNIRTMPSTHPFIQIICKNRNHWITLSNMDQTYNTVDIYDSYMDLKYSDEDLIQLASTCATLLKSDEDSFKIRFHDLQQQCNGSDCGYMAIAVATDLSFRKDPSKSFFDPVLLRTHLAECVKGEYFFEFPKAPRKSLGVIKEITVEIICICRLPFILDIPYVDCIQCKKKFHLRCIISVDDAYCCDFCKI